MDDFYAARTANAAALPWTNIATPFTLQKDQLELLAFCDYPAEHWVLTCMQN